MLSLDFASAQTNRTWNGSVNTDWFNATNWIPAGVPATNDVINFTSGTINLTAPVILNGQLNWSGGYLTGNALTIASNGVMNISGTTTLFLENSLTNAGTVIWTNSGNLDVVNGGGPTGLIENLAGALWDIQNDQSLFNNNLGPAYFHNAGTLRKSASTFTTTFSIPIINSGSVTGLLGTLNFGGGGILAGTFTAAAGAAIGLSGGSFSNSMPVAINGSGTVQLTGGSLTLLADVIANLPLTGGTVNLGPAFQGGTITNLTIAGATLAGTNTVTGTFNWNNGVIAGGPLTIASNAVMNIRGTTTLYLDNALTNAGTVTWTNNGNLNVLNGTGGAYTGLIENLAGALWDIQNDQTLFNNSLGPAYFHNAGTLRKSAHTNNTTTISIPIINSSSVSALQGTLDFSGGGILAGTFTAAAGAAISFSGGSFTNSGPVAINGPGIAQLTGIATLTLLTDTIINLPLMAGTVNLGPAFQGGTITNLTIAGATLAGTNTVTGTFNWNNGTIAGGPLTIASNGVMNIRGTTTLYLENALTNAGTVTWTNNGSLDVLNGNGATALIENLAGALWDIQNDQSLFNNNIGPAYFHNAGTLRKSSHTGTTYITIPLTNSGMITALQGNLAVNNGFTPVGGTMLFGLSSPASYGTMSIAGTATLGGTVGVLWLNGFVPASGNSFTVLAYGSFTGAFTNFSLPSAALWVTNYGPTSFTIAVANINKLVFTAQPVGGKLTNVILAPVVVQIEDPGSNPVATNGVLITLSLNSGSGSVNGALTQNTDSTGKATFGDLSFNTVGTKTLRATDPGLTSAISIPFQIVPLIGEQWTNGGLVLQLNGSNNLAPITIYTSTNLLTWLPIYTNAPTNGLVQFLDTSATNHPIRFYHVVEQ